MKRIIRAVSSGVVPPVLYTPEKNDNMNVVDMLSRSFSGSGETRLTSDVCVFSAVESIQTVDYAETWTDDIAYRDKSSLYATAPRSKVSMQQ